MANESFEAGKTKTRILALILIVFQIAISLIYGLCGVNAFNFINITSVFMAIALALLTVAGTLPPTKVLDFSSPITDSSPGRGQALRYS